MTMQASNSKWLSYTGLMLLTCIAPSLQAQEWEKQSTSPTHIHLYAVDFIDENLGWIAGGNAAEGGIWKTTDGGTTWETQRYSEIAEFEFDDLCMLDAQQGWASGSDFIVSLDRYGAALFRTLDGGENWVQMPTPQGSGGNAVTVTRVEFITPQIGWMSTRPSGAVSSLYSTTNGGANWTLLRDVALDSWCFVDEMNGWAADQDHRFIYTNDGGQTWIDSPVQPVANSEGSTVSEVFSASEATVTTFEPWPTGFRVHHTFDGGQSWQSIDSGTGTRWQYYFDSLHGWGVSNGIQRTTDGGSAWVEQRPELMIAETLRDGDVVDGNTVYLVGDYGYILKTNDAGETWSQISEGSGRDLFNIDFVNEQIGWATGDGNTILHTTDGGDTWTHQFSAEQMFSNPREVRAFDEQTVMVYYGDESPVGEAGIIITYDGGQTWQNMAAGTFWPSGPVYFPDLQRGYKINRWGINFYKTTNGGKTWSSHPTGLGPFGANNAILDIYFVDDLHGWCVGYYNKAFRTTDGGITWEPMLDVYNQVFRQVRFTDPLIGWVVGNDGFVARTTDGGVNWEIQTQPGTLFEHIQDMLMPSPNELYICSREQSNGMAYVRYTNDAGKTWSFAQRDIYEGVGLGLAIEGDRLWTTGTHGNIYRRDLGCVADLNDDGTLDFFDVSTFLNAFNAEDTAADLTGDGVYDFFDISVFLSIFYSGCP